MAADLYVPDANVFLEYIYARPLQEVSKKIIRDAVLERIQLAVPCLLLDEITEVLCGNMENLADVQAHLRHLENLTRQKVLHVVVPSCALRMKGVELARTGNKKSGCPELSDCLYHAFAILHGGVFVTNDKRHFAKVKQFGHIMLLEEYGGKICPHAEYDEAPSCLSKKQ
jgi:predicted nucleic acid-binding protein